MKRHTKLGCPRPGVTSHTQLEHTCQLKRVIRCSRINFGCFAATVTSDCRLVGIFQVGWAKLTVSPAHRIMLRIAEHKRQHELQKLSYLFHHHTRKQQIARTRVWSRVGKVRAKRFVEARPWFEFSASQQAHLNNPTSDNHWQRNNDNGQNYGCTWIRLRLSEIDGSQNGCVKLWFTTTWHKRWQPPPPRRHNSTWAPVC